MLTQTLLQFCNTKLTKANWNLETKFDITDRKLITKPDFTKHEKYFDYRKGIKVFLFRYLFLLHVMIISDLVTHSPESLYILLRLLLGNTDFNYYLIEKSRFPSK